MRIIVTARIVFEVDDKLAQEAMQRGNLTFDEIVNGTCDELKELLDSEYGESQLPDGLTAEITVACWHDGGVTPDA